MRTGTALLCFVLLALPARAQEKKINWDLDAKPQIAMQAGKLIDWNMDAKVARVACPCPCGCPDQECSCPADSCPCKCGCNETNSSGTDRGLCNCSKPAAVKQPAQTPRTLAADDGGPDWTWDEGKQMYCRTVDAFPAPPPARQPVRYFYQQAGNCAGGR